MLKISIRQYITFLAVIALLVFLHLIGVLRPVESVLARLLNPVMHSLYSFSTDVRSVFSEQSDKEDLHEKIKQLEQQVGVLTVANVSLELLEEENKILREHHEFLANNNYQYILGKVIARGDIGDISGRTETIIIDRGERDGIYPGLSVVDSEGIIVGKIFEVKEKISLVYLTNSKKCELAAAVLNDDKTAGIARGELGLTIKMDFIPQDEEIFKDDIIVTSGLEEAIPRGLIIGRVIEVNKKSNELWQTATIEPLVNLDKLIIISVLLP